MGLQLVLPVTFSGLTHTLLEAQQAEIKIFFALHQKDISQSQQLGFV